MGSRRLLGPQRDRPVRSQAARRGSRDLSNLARGADSLTSALVRVGHRANALRSTVRVGGAQPDGGIGWATAQIGVYARSCFLMEVTAGHCRDGSMISGNAAAARQARRTTATTSQARGPADPGILVACCAGEPACVLDPAGGRLS